MAEVAAIGGFVKQYNVIVDPHRLRAQGITLRQILQSIRGSNMDVGGRTVEMSEFEFMVRGRGYLKSIQDIESIVLKRRPQGRSRFWRARRAIPVDAASVDTVVTTWTMCSIPDASATLSEMRRVLRPGGDLLFVGHGRAPDPSVARWQDSLDPAWNPVAGGCHLNRPIAHLIIGTGFKLVDLRTGYAGRPRAFKFIRRRRAPGLSVFHLVWTKRATELRPQPFCTQALWSAPVRGTT